MPKITKAGGPSFETDVPQQRDGEQVPIAANVPHGDAREAEAYEVNRAATERMAGSEEVRQVNDDAEEIEERPRPDYSGWTKAQLNTELNRREIEHDPKANNPALVELLEDSDAGRAHTEND